MLKLKHLWLEYGITAVVVCLAAWELIGFIQCACNQCQANYDNHHVNQATAYICLTRGPIGAIGRLGTFIERHVEPIALVISAVATLAIAAFTRTLQQSTAHLGRIAANQEQTARRHERAYVLWGGLYGTERSDEHYEIEAVKRDARRYDLPWIMQVHNFGRTPGFITEVRWGICESEADFSSLVGTSALTPLIESGVLPTTSVKREIVVNPTTNDRPWPYRFVRVEERKPGNVLYGRIDYGDVFGDTHHSTWAGLIEPAVLTPIGEFMANDWS